MYYLYLKPICKSMLSQGKDQYEKDDRNFILDLNLLLLCSLFLFNFVVIVCIGTLIIRVIVTICFHFTWMQVFSLIIVQAVVRCWLINFFRHKEHERNMVVHAFLDIWWEFNCKEVTQWRIYLSFTETVTLFQKRMGDLLAYTLFLLQYVYFC